MKKLNKVAVFLLTLVMVIEAIPLTFLSTNATASTEPPTEPQTTYFENMQTYVNYNGGQMIFASDFNTDGDTSSALGLTTKLGLITKDDSTSEIKGGYLVVTSKPKVGKENDPFTNCDFNAESGDSITAEFTMTVTEKPSSDSTVMYFRDRGHGKAGKKDTSFTFQIAGGTGDDILFREFSSKNVMFQTKLNTEVKVVVQLVPKEKTLNVYLDGDLVRAMDISAKLADSGYTCIDGDFPAFNETRWLQMSGSNTKGQVKINHLAVYKNVDVPYLMSSVNSDFNRIDAQVKAWGGKTGGIIQAYYDQGSNTGFKKNIGEYSIGNISANSLKKENDGFIYIGHEKTAEGTWKHGYLNINPGMTEADQGKTFVFDSTIKYQDFSNGAIVECIFSTLDTAGKHTTSTRYWKPKIDCYNGVLSCNGINFYKLELNKEYRIQLACEVMNNTYKVYINGEFVFEDAIISQTDIDTLYHGDIGRMYPVEFRSFQCSNGTGKRGVKNVYCYSLPKGSDAKFLDTTDTLLTGYKNDYAYIDGVKQDFQGIHTVNGITYSYGYDNKIMTNEYIIDGLNTIYAGGNSVPEVRKPIKVETIVSVEDWARKNNNGTIEYSNGVPTAFDLCGLRSERISGINKSYQTTHIRFSFYIGENNLVSGKDSVGLHIESDEEHFKINKFSGTLEKNKFVIEELGEKVTSMGEGTVVDTGIYTTFKNKSYRIKTVTRKDGTVDYYARFWTYASCGLNLSKYAPGWHTVEFQRGIDYPVRGVTFNTNGWKYICSTQDGGGNLDPAEVAKIPFKLGDVQLVTYEPVGTENGIVGDYYYENGLLKSGFVSSGEGGKDKYYFSSDDGKMAKGVTYVKEEGLWYNFGTDGKLIGTRNGKFTDEILIKDTFGTEYKTKQVERLYENGKLGIGLTTLASGDRYYSETTYGEILKNQVVLFDGNGDAVKYCGEDGKITDYALNLKSLTNVSSENGTAIAEFEVNGVTKTVEVKIVTWYGKLGLEKKADGKYYSDYVKNDVQYFDIAGEKGYRYFDENGAMVKDLPGVTYIKKHGIIGTGLVTTAKGKYYFKDGVMQKNATCAVDANNYVVTGTDGIVTSEIKSETPLKSADVYFCTENGTLLRVSKYYEKDTKVEFPNVMTRTGYTFDKWEFDDAAIISKIDGTNSRIIVRALYTKDSTQYDITVKNGEKPEGVITKVTVGDKFEVKAEAVAGKKFSNWVNGKGEICSYNETLTIYASKNETYEAVYVNKDAIVDKKAVILNVTNTFVDDYGDKYITVLFERTLPENANFLEYYVERATTDKFAGEKVVKINAKKLTAVMYRLKITGSEDKRFYIRAAVRYEINGQEITEYSDILGVSFNNTENIIKPNKNILEIKDWYMLHPETDVDRFGKNSALPENCPMGSNEGYVLDLQVREYGLSKTAFGTNKNMDGGYYKLTDGYYDMSDWQTMEFAIYVPAENGKMTIQMNIGSENKATSGWDYYSKRLVLNTGWNHFIVYKTDLGSSRTPLGWDKIDSFKFNFDGWNQNNPKTGKIYLSEIKLTNEMYSEKGINGFEQLKNSASFAVGGYAGIINADLIPANKYDLYGTETFKEGDIYYLPVNVFASYYDQDAKFNPKTNVLEFVKDGKAYVFKTGNTYTENGKIINLEYTAKVNGKALYISHRDAMVIFGYTEVYTDAMGFISLSNEKNLYDAKRDSEKIYGAVQACIYNRPSVEMIENKFYTHSQGLHPYIMLDAEDFANINNYKKTDLLLQQYISELENKYGIKSTEFKSDTVKYDIRDGKRLLGVSRKAMERITSMALLYKLYEFDKPEDAKLLAERIWKEVEAVANFPDWHPQHFLDTAELAYPMAVAYDWLYDYWTPERRTVIEDAIYNHGLRATTVLNGSYNLASSTNNWNGVCNGGIMSAALAILPVERYSYDAKKVISYSIGAVERGMWVYGPDGGYEEGPGYWSYGTTYLQIFISSLDKACGTNFGIYNSPGFADSVYFTTYLETMKNTWGFHDGGSGSANTDIAPWFAVKENDGNINTIRRQALSNNWKAVSIYDIMYFRPDLVNSKIDLSLDAIYTLDTIMTFRDSWDTQKSVFAGLHGGDNAASHGDLDTGNFVISVNGTSMICELGSENYNVEGYFGSYRWSYYRKRAEGQNTLVMIPHGQSFNDKAGDPNNKVKATPDQVPNSFSECLRFESSEKAAVGVVNMAPAYSNMTSGKRGLYYKDNRTTIVIQDEAKFNTAMDIYWFAHTEGNITISADGKSAVIARNGIYLYAEIVSAQNVTFTTMKAVSLDANYKGDKIGNSSYPKGGYAEKDRSEFTKLCVKAENVTELNLAVVFKVISAPADVPAFGTTYVWTEIDKWTVK